MARNRLIYLGGTAPWGWPKSGAIPDLLRKIRNSSKDRINIKGYIQRGTAIRKLNNETLKKRFIGYSYNNYDKYSPRNK